VETDNQLRLDDLLASALLSSPITDNDFSQTVMALADLRCLRHSPSEVFLRQLGIRSWSGIGLAMAIAVTLAVIPLRPARSQATDANISALTADNVESPNSNVSQQGHGTGAPGADPMNEAASNQSMRVEQPVDHTGASSSQPPTRPGMGTGAQGGSSTNSQQSPEMLRNAGSDSQPQNTDGTTAAGGAGLGTGTRQGTPGHGTASATSPKPVPAWSGGGDANSRSSAAIPDNQIPPEDRDLVREYFSARK
jgi:hypothetical protein